MPTIDSCPVLPEPAQLHLAEPLNVLLAAIGLWLAGSPAVAAPTLPAVLPGVVQERRLPDDDGQRYFVYVPKSGGQNRPLFVTIHGISRNAREHAREFSRLADDYGVVVVAPLFDERRFPDYQRLGRSGRGERADLMLERIVADAARLSGARADKIHLFGFSGGGQFAHRYALAHPDRIAAYAVGAAGWYTFPESALQYPLGTGNSPRLPDLRFEPRDFLAVPAAVFVGERDIRAGRALRQSPHLSAEQGDNRYERGRSWITEMTLAAREHCLDTEFRFETLPQSPHSFLKSMRRGRLGERIFAWLFDAAEVDVRPCHSAAAHLPALPRMGSASPGRQGMGMSGL